ncbi:MAG: SGNH/GDSL hydrolase family protein [Hyphomicrobiales bacterium]|nr:SGNH/GDSL hydrolase family protein [Hyphomicrobiales bacterium]
MSINCAVPNSSLADRAPLPRLAKRLRNNTKPVVLAVGSSSTWGVGSSSRRKTYPAQLEHILEKAWLGKDVEVINRGVSGETASGTADRMLNLAAQFKPDLVLWQLGTNDAVLRVRIDDFTHTVVSTVRKLREANIDVVLVGLQYTPKWARDSHYFAVRDALYKIAKQEKLLYVRRYKAMEFLARTHKSLRLMSRDNFHLNDLGYQCMAEQVAQAVVTNLFLRRTPAQEKQKVQ